MRVKPSLETQRRARQTFIGDVGAKRKIELAKPAAALFSFVVAVAVVITTQLWATGFSLPFWRCWVAIVDKIIK